jgi:hypothetical protein
MGIKNRLTVMSFLQFFVWGVVDYRWELVWNKDGVAI